MYTLKNNNGKINFLLRSGKDFVKNEIPITSAQHIVDNGEIKLSDVEGYPINISDKWYFEGNETQPIVDYEETNTNPEKEKQKGGKKKT